ncbi:MAG: T9SS type A sorting domain-containing protein [Balneolaceae bacterium]|nr:T9SS type A sorting domain-containing protein [Balneolaceae bacterium]
MRRPETNPKGLCIYVMFALFFLLASAMPEQIYAQFTVTEGSTYNGAVENGDAPFTLIQEPSYGTLTFNSDGSFTYTAHRQPTAGFQDTDSFEYKSNDQEESDDPYVVSITITPVNDAPVAQSKSFTVDLGDTHSGQVTATDVDGDALTYALQTGPDNGTLVFNTNGSFSYTANSYGDGTDSFTFVANDGWANSEPATVSINISSAFCGGSGTEAEPYLICTADQLNNVREDLSAYYKLANDIDMDVAPYNEGEGWEPIGKVGSAFTGTFDGAIYTINNLFIDRSEETHIGLFGLVNNAFIENVGLEDVNITGNRFTGGLMGYNGNNGTIIESYFIGSVTGTDNYTGGLVGFNEGGDIIDSHATGTVNGTGWRVGGLVGRTTSGSIIGSFANCQVNGHNSVGGLVGESWNSSIISSYATGDVSGGYSVGGLVGTASGIVSIITDSYASGVVSATEDRVGGLVGILSDNSSVKRSYAVGEVVGIVDNIGGLLGRLDNSTVEDSYYDKETTGQSDDEGKGTPKTMAEMKQITTFSAWDIALTDTELNDGYPFLAWQDDNEDSVWLITGEELFCGGSGDEHDPYLICTADELNNIREDLTAHYKLANDIDLDIAPYNEGEGWEPIGSHTDRFIGSFDGESFVIMNLYVNRPETFNIGLFGYTENANITNVRLEGLEVTGGSLNVGGLIGRTRTTDVSNSYVNGNVTGGNMTGGLVGMHSDNSTITNSYATGMVGSIADTENHGGLVGQVDNSTITNSYTVSTVEGNISVGGLVGKSHRGIVINSYAINNVHGNDRVGGLIGNNHGTETHGHSEAELTESYAAGTVNGSTNVGGLVGENTGSVTNSFYDRDTSGQEDDDGRGTPKTTAEMKQQSTFTTAGADWDFTNLWAIESGDYISYPYFGNSDEAPEQDPPPGLVRVAGFDEAPRLFAAAGKEVPVTTQHILFEGGESVTITQLPVQGTLLLDGTAVENNDVIHKGDVEAGKLGYIPEKGIPATVYVYGYDQFIYENSEEQRTLPVDLAAQAMPYEFTEGWFLFSSPGDGQTVGELLGNIRTDGYPGSTNPGASFPTVYTLDQDAYQWAAVTSSDQVLVQGAGLLVYVFEEDTPAEDLLFSEGPWAPLDGSFTFDHMLWYDPDQGPQGDSHFLIGNPHPVAINICNMIMEGTNMANSLDIWAPWENDGHGGYINFSCEITPRKVQTQANSDELQQGEILFEGYVPPFIGFWVRTTADNPSLAITENDYVGMPRRKQTEAKPEPVTLVLSHEERNYANTVNILFSDRGSDGLDEIDAIKLSSAGLAKRYLSFFAMDEEGRKYALRSLPTLMQDEVTIPLGIETTEEGSYTLTWSLPDAGLTGANYYLRDHHAGTTVQLRDGQSYRFDLEATTAAKAIDPPLLRGDAKGVFSARIAEHESTPRFELIVTTGELKDGGSELPAEIVLNQNYPNPFNPATIISYELPEQVHVRLDVYDMTGRHVAELVNEQINAGQHRVTFNAMNLSSGVYIYRLQAGNEIQTRKLTIIK